MGLLSTDITKVKRLSLKEVKLPATEVREEPTVTPIHVKKPLSNEEVGYRALIAEYPLVERLVRVFHNLSKEDPAKYSALYHVSETSGRITGRVKVREEYDSLEEPEVLSKETVALKEIALRLIEGGKSYSKNDIVERLMIDTKVHIERAERGFRLMLEAGAIEQTINPELYFLGGSTPF
jgi:hypothetical protein